mmetsp:Transcript_21805/g.64289  ORF Transcript_21805/g.64289 Transcript_21805/m.64289 type:complete len:742 (+) Transcript_21805:219-2444(+)
MPLHFPRSDGGRVHGRPRLTGDLELIVRLQILESYSGWTPAVPTLEGHLESIPGDIGAVGLENPQPVGAENGVQFLHGGKLHHDIIPLELHGEGEDLEISAVELGSGVESEGLLVERARDLGRAGGVADDPLTEHEGLLVGAHVLGDVPFAPLGVVEYGELSIPDEDGSADVDGKVGDGADPRPRFFGPGEDVVVGRGPVGMILTVGGPIGGTLLTALIDEFEHVLAFDGLVGVDELLELLAARGILDDLGPFVVVGIDEVLHAIIELSANAEGVLDDDLLEMFDRSASVLAGGELLLPRRHAFHLIGGQYVIHNVSIEIGQHRILVDIGGEKLGVFGDGAAVPPDVQVVSVLGGDHAEILTDSLGAFPRASAHPALHLVRGADALVSILDPYGEADRILNAVAAPRRSDARFDGAEGLPVRVSALESGVAQILPNVGELMLRRAEEIDPLPSRNLGVEVVLVGGDAEGDELIGAELSSRDAGYDGIGTPALHVGEGSIVGIEEGVPSVVENDPVHHGGEYGGHGRLAHLASVSAPVFGQYLLEGIDRRRIGIGADQRHEFRTGHSEMFAHGRVQRSPELLELLGEDLLHLRLAPAASRSGLGALLEGGEGGPVHAQFLHGRGDGPAGHVVARTDLGVRVGRDLLLLEGSPAGARGRKESSGIFGNLALLDVHGVKAGIVGRVSDEDAALELGPILGEVELAIDPALGIVPDHGGDVRVVLGGVSLAEGCHVAPQQLELGG